MEGLVEIPDWVGQKYTYEEWPQTWHLDEVTVTLPPKPPKSKVANYGKPKRLQKFEQPDKEMMWTIHGKMVAGIDLSPEEEEFVDQQWYYRRNGYWFFNNGYLEYLTPDHWYYLSYFKMRIIGQKIISGRVVNAWDFGSPYYVDSDRDFFYVWDHAVFLHTCCGLLFITNRRDGKTYKMSSIGINYVTGNRNTNVALQSKGFSDAKEIMDKTVESWAELPAYFKPVDSGYTNPQSGIAFRAPTKLDIKGTSAKVDALNSWMRPFSSTNVKLDGLGIGRVLVDEVGKTTEVDVEERHEITKPALKVGSTVIGKCLMTTTVEDLEKMGGQACKNLWDASNPNDLDETGSTETGMIRFFKPAFYGFAGEDGGERFIDEYGYSNCEAARAFQMKQFARLSGKKLWDLQRKYPHNITQAFRSSMRDNAFDIDSIFQQIDYNDTARNLYRQGDFFGDVDKREEIRFVDNPEGLFRFSWAPDVKMQNGPRPFGIMDKPLNYRMGAFGVDSADQFKKELAKGSGSNMAITGMHDYLPDSVYSSFGTFLQYLGRPESPFTFYNSCFAACIFFGMQALVENNKSGIVNEAIRLDMLPYLIKTNKRDTTSTGAAKMTIGVNTSGPYVRRILVEAYTEHVLRYVGQISERVQKDRFGLSVPEKDVKGPVIGHFPFNDVLNQAADFDMNDWEKYDAIVSAMLSNYAIRMRHQRDVRDDQGSNRKGPDMGVIF